MCPDDRMNHTRVVDQRCEQMLMRGLVKETADLQLNGIFPEMATKAIGYRQTLDYLNRDDTSNDEAAAFDAYIDDFTTATRRYAKKQMAWFRKDKDFCFVPVPLLQSKTDRVAVTAQEVMRLIAMSRDDYEAELSSPKSQSAQTKKRNEAQGKTMKFYKFQRHLLTKGSAELERALQEAIECSNRMRSKRKKLDGVAESN
uniref:tRNA dimethylallyltransferase n=1 Tax=Craspedostauros australis TaxID=1486917 RepID=A0A7R9ZQ88_9STRA